MTEILHLSGPAFLLLYCLLFAVAMMAGRAIHDSLWKSNKTHTLFEPCPLHELAYLSGGQVRAVATALVRLANLGHVALAPNGKGVHLLVEPDGNAHPLEKSIFRAVGINPVFGTRSLSGDVFKETVKRLQVRGFLSDPNSPAQRWGALPLALVILLGFSKLWVGLSNGRPVFLLSALLVISLFILYGCQLRSMRTPLGKDFLEHMTRRNAALKPTDSNHIRQLSNADLLLAVALFGTQSLAGTPLDWLRINGLLLDAADLKKLRVGSNGSDDSSGADGGGGCGGGCGGCGGD